MLTRMHCTHRVLSLTSLVFGLAATGALSLAVATDYWLYTTENVNIDKDMMDPKMVEPMMNGTISFTITTVTHTGLWRMCIVPTHLGMEDEVNPVPTKCDVLSNPGGRSEEATITMSIFQAITLTRPVFLGSLFLMVIALGISIVGNTSRDWRTILGAGLFTFSSLGLAGGVVVYISSVNDEISHRKPSGPDGVGAFRYSYGWAFFSAGSSFVAAMVAAVTNITLYLNKYSQLDEMTQIIPGLDKQANETFGPRREFESGLQIPTVIL